MITAILFAVFFVLLIIDVPIAICLGASSVAAILAAGQKLSVVAVNTYSGISKTLLLAIPFFVLAGNIMAKAGISKRLIAFVNACIGHTRGGIAIVCVIVSCLFGAISGSGPATVAALGAILIPAMIEAGFSAPFATALMAASSSIAIIIPPSIAYVVYASITGDDVGKLFMAGVVPGILMGVALIAVVLIEVHRKNIQSTKPRSSAKERWDAFKDASWAFLMPVIILGGIYGGIFTPTEAAAVSIVYGLLVSLFVYKEIKFKDILAIAKESAFTSAKILFIIGLAGYFGRVMTLIHLPNEISTFILGISSNKYVLLFLIALLFLILGMVMETSCAILIVTPILLPIAMSVGINPIHLGIIMVFDLAIGVITPPMAVNIFIGSQISGVPVAKMIKPIMPFVLASMALLMFIVYIPQLSLAFV